MKLFAAAGSRVVCLALLGLVWGCRSERQQAPAGQPSAAPIASAEAAVGSAAAVGSGAGAAGAPDGGSEKIDAEGKGRQGSTVALARLSGRAVALVADADGAAVHVIDREKRAVVSSLGLGAAPGQLLITREGKALVALRGGSEVRVLGGRAGGKLAVEATVATAPEPWGLALTPDGATLLVASAWGRRLEGFVVASRERKFSIELPRDPRSVLVTDDGKKAFVSHAAGSIASLVALPAAGEPGEARAVRLDGVTNMPSYMGNHAQRFGSQGFSLAQVDGRVLVPQALVNAGLRNEKQGNSGGSMFGNMFDPVSPGASGARGRPDGVYGGSGEDPYPVALQDVAVIDAASPYETRRSPGLYQAEKLDASVHYLHLVLGKTLAAEPGSVVVPDGLDSGEAGRFNACSLPRAAAADEAQKTLLVACQGSDTVLELDATAADPARHELRRFAAPAGPTGVALDEGARQALVFSQFDRALVTFELGPAVAPGKKTRPHNRLVTQGGKKRIEVIEPTARVDLPTEGALPPGLAAGRRLFHATGNELISGDGRACASCHPDGRDDALSWATPEGPRQTPSLAGRSLSTTAPFGWRGAHSTLKIHLESTFRRLRGKGLPEAELAALLDYVLSMPAPPRRTSSDPRVARGKELFEGSTGCVACHGAPAYTDHLSHDVKSGLVFDTPSLLSVGGTAPYFHDGRYKTLRDMLRDSDGKMGSTAGLSPADLEALEAYLLEL